MTFEELEVGQAFTDEISWVIPNIWYQKVIFEHGPYNAIRLHDECPEWFSSDHRVVTTANPLQQALRSAGEAKNTPGTSVVLSFKQWRERLRP